MVLEGRSLADLKQGMKKFPQTMVNVKISERQDPMKNKTVADAVKEVEAELADTGRVLLRASGTEPLIRVMIEGEDQILVKKLANELADVVKINL